MLCTLLTRKSFRYTSSAGIACFDTVACLVCSCVSLRLVLRSFGSCFVFSRSLLEMRHVTAIRYHVMTLNLSANGAYHGAGHSLTVGASMQRSKGTRVSQGSQGDSQLRLIPKNHAPWVLQCTIDTLQCRPMHQNNTAIHAMHVIAFQCKNHFKSLTDRSIRGYLH